MTHRAQGTVIAAAVAGIFVAKGASAQAYRNAEEMAANRWAVGEGAKKVLPRH
jgi:hypothetical protein